GAEEGMRKSTDRRTAVPARPCWIAASDTGRARKTVRLKANTTGENSPPEGGHYRYSIRGDACAQARNQVRVLVLAREFEGGLALLGLHVGPRAGLEQHVDHRRRAEVDRRRVEERRHAVAVHVVDVGALRNQKLRHLDLIAEDGLDERRDARVGAIDRRAEL